MLGNEYVTTIAFLNGLLNYHSDVLWSCIAMKKSMSNRRPFKLEVESVKFESSIKLEGGLN